MAERFRRNGTWWAPTLVVFYAAENENVMGGREDAPRSEPVFARYRSTRQRVLGRFFGKPEGPTISGRSRSHRRRPCPHPNEAADADSLGLMHLVQRVGLPILASSDAIGRATGFSLHTELAAFVAEGLTPLAALQSATLNPAKFLHGTDSLGTIAAGKLADLVLLDADPLADIANTTNDPCRGRQRPLFRPRGPRSVADGYSSQGATRGAGSKTTHTIACRPTRHAHTFVRGATISIPPRVGTRYHTEHRRERRHLQGSRVQQSAARRVGLPIAGRPGTSPLPWGQRTGRNGRGREAGRPHLAPRESTGGHSSLLAYCRRHDNGAVAGAGRSSGRWSCMGFSRLVLAGLTSRNRLTAPCSIFVG